MTAMARNNAHIVGSGQTTLVMAHSFGTDQTAWRDQDSVLAERYRIVLFDHAGAGGSDPSAYSPHRSQNLRSYAFDLIELCDEWQVSDVDYVGHSMSVMVGVLAALPVQVGEYLVRNMPQAKLQMLDATGHLPHRSSPKQVTNAIRAFAE